MPRSAFPPAILLLVAISIPAADPVPPDHAAKMAASATLFKEKVGPFFRENCLECHGGAKTKSGFSLANREVMLAGGDRGKSVLPGKGAESPLVKYVARTDEPHMPPKKPVGQETVAALVQWIDSGAAFDKPLVETTVPAGKKPLEVTAKDKDYWAYRPLAKTAVPQVQHIGWPQNKIDRFVLAKLEEKGIAPAADADKRTLIRRVYFDLIGLPPSPAAVEAFVADESPNAFEKVVDELLASKQYGERWARHWLDPARYAESHGFEHDYYRPHAYHYRDFVIRALNADMPYDKFVKLQIAGDEFEPDNPDALAATGFLGAGVYPTQITTREAERVRYDAMDDMAATTGYAILALTVACARCHDHKYDPIPTRDYYRLLAAFTTTVRSEVEVDLGTPEEKAATAEFDSMYKPLSAARTKFRGWKTLDVAVKQLEKHRPKVTKVKIQATTEGRPPMRHHTNDGSVPDFYAETFLLKRGDPAQKDGTASPGVLQVLARTDEKQWQTPKPPSAKTSYRRTSLANWLTDTETGAGSLAARAIVNRLWHHHFGRGIVSTLNDFGFQGDPPTHPELLEWLANDLVEHGWKLKPIHKQIVMSRVYQLAGTPSSTAKKLDPDNRTWSFRPRRRLEAEAIRDNLLAVSGQLDPTMYGEGTLDEAMKRRAIYFRVQRSQMIPMLQVFDWPDTLSSAAARPTTTVAPQALLFLNNPHVRSWAAAFGAKLKTAAQKSPADAVELAYRTAFSRPPTKREIDAGVAFLAERGAGGKLDRALTEYALALMSLNEFLYVD